MNSNLASPLPSADDPITSCALAASLSVVSGKWKPPILWHLLSGPKRPGELRRLIGAVSEKVLVEQLRQLEDDGIVLRTDFKTKPLRVEYRLSEIGLSLVPVLARLSRWGQAHIERVLAARRTPAGPEDVADASVRERLLNEEGCFEPSDADRRGP